MKQAVCEDDAAAAVYVEAVAVAAAGAEWLSAVTTVTVEELFHLL